MSRAIPENVRWAMGMARARFLHGLDSMPDDKLEWTPGGSATNALQLAGKVAGFGGFISSMLGGGAPDPNASRPAPPSNRAEARAAAEGGFAALDAMLAGLTEADLDRVVKAPWNAEYSVAKWVAMLPSVTGYFQGQLNYLQLAYGDEDPHIPAEWGHG